MDSLVEVRAGLGVLHQQLDRGRQLDVQRDVVVHRDDGVLVLEQEFLRVADQRGVDVEEGPDYMVIQPGAPGVAAGRTWVVVRSAAASDSVQVIVQ